MKLTKVLISSAVAVFGMLEFNANAGLPAGFESVNVKATLLAQDGNKVDKTKITSDDVLGLIDEEYDTSFSKQDGGSGFKLVSYGFDDEDLAVLDKDGNVVLSNASSDGDNYFLEINPFNVDEWVETISGSDDEKYNYTIAGVSVSYGSDDEFDSFNFIGSATDKVNYDTDNESYSLKNGEGVFDFESGDVSGIITGAGVSGSGKDIIPFDD